MRPPPQPAATSRTPLASAPTFHVTPCWLVFGHDHSLRVVSASQQPFLPPAVLVPPVREPIARRTRSRAPAALALFASGGQFHECVQYHIPMAKPSCASSVAMGFAGLCTIHHMSTAYTSNFAALCSALLHKNNLLALSILDPTTGNMLEHCQLQRDPRYKMTWDTLYPMSLAVSAKAPAQGRPPTPNVLPVPTHSFASTKTTSRHTRGRKYATLWWFVKSDWKRMTLSAHESPLLATASATLVMWAPTKHPWNSSSYPLTVYSRKKVHALAPLTLQTSTSTCPCPSRNTFASKS